MTHRPGERKCAECGEWKHHSRFRSWRDDRLRNSTVSVSFSPLCRDCEQKLRNIKKNVDRPLALIRQRAQDAARRAGATAEFFWTQMNYASLVPMLRAMMTSGSTCQMCGHDFVGERDIQIEHCEPPRNKQDWARLHARNVRFACGSCNRTKSKKPFAHWLDEQEMARISNLADKPKVDIEPSVQFKFEL